MWEEKKETSKAKERLWKLLDGMNRGDLLTHEAAEKALGMTRELGSRYYAVIDHVRRKLEETRGITLVSQPLIGYLVASTKEQLEAARHRNTRAGRQLRRAYKTVACIPAEDCNPLEAKAKFAMEEKLAASEKQMRSQSQLMAFLMRPRDVGPRIARDDEEQQETA